MQGFFNFIIHHIIIAPISVLLHDTMKPVLILLILMIPYSDKWMLTSNKLYKSLKWFPWIVFELNNHLSADNFLFHQMKGCCLKSLHSILIFKKRRLDLSSFCKLLYSYKRHKLFLNNVLSLWTIEFHLIFFSITINGPSFWAKGYSHG